jgi:hypothetical protein
MSSMTIKTFVNVAKRLPADTSILIRGAHGIGKSQIVRQIAEQLRSLMNLAELPVIDRRLSQMSEGDVVGLPSTDGNVTRFNPPDWYKKACVEPCILFLDELNRATPEVMQAAFQIVLDRELNGHRLHPQTRVFSAVNASAAYTVNEIDPALLDRFWTIDLDPDRDDWLAWARESGIADCIIEFHSVNSNWLDTPKNVESNVVAPSRRSWERLSKALVAEELAEKPDDNLFYSICIGYVGTEASIAFTQFCKTIDNRFSGKDIINDYDSVRKKVLRGNSISIMNAACDYVAEYLLTLDKVTPEQGENLRKFFNDVPKELRLNTWGKVVKHGVQKLDLAASIHEYVVDALLEVFGTKRGAAGVGMVPIIPDIFNKK